MAGWEADDRVKVIIEAINTPSLYKELGSTAVLRAEAIRGFTSSDGQIIPPSNGNGEFYLEVPITIANDEMLIPSFEIDSTEDAMPWDSAILGDVPGYRFTIVTARRKKIPYFINCKIPALTGEDTGYNWGELRIYNRNFHRRFTQLDRLVNVDQVLTWIQDALGSRGKSSPTNWGVTAISTAAVDPLNPIAVSDTDPRLLVASEVTLGRLRLSVPPVDANDPIAVGDNDPRLAATEALQGTGTLVAGAATILEPTTMANSPILAVSMSNGVTGNLRPSNRVEGQSFDITSDNNGDAGDFRWFLY